MLSRFRPAIRAWLFGLVLAVAIVAAYAVSLPGAFLWDDDMHITANPTIVGPLGLKEIWTSARALYFPLTLTNFWVQHALWGLEPFGYRVVTLGFHVGAALLLWRVLLGLRVPGAWMGAALWALHPVQVESVAWICELKNTQSAVFFLAAVLMWVRRLESDNAPPASPSPDAKAGKAARAPAMRPVASGGETAYAWTLLFAVLAILSKPSTVMLPVVLGLCTWWLSGRITWKEAARLAPFFALSAVASGWTIWEQKFNSGAIGEEWSQTLPERFAIAGRVIWFYLGKLAWPDPLIFIYPRWEIDGGNPWVYLGLVAAIVVAVVLWLGRGGRLRPLFFGGVYFVAMLFPVLGFFSVYFFRYSFVGDHFQYLASMGPLALAGAALALLPRRLPHLVGGVLACTLGLLTAQHARIFLADELLWRDIVAKNPDAVMAWFNLGDELAQQGRHEESIAAFEAGLARKPDDLHALNDLGNELVISGRPEEGVVRFQRVLSIDPDYAAAHTNLGNALDDLGRPEEALVHYLRAAELEPGEADLQNNLGVALAKAGRGEEAVARFEAALRLRPDDAPTHDNLAGALRSLGRFEEALAQHETALRLNPASAEALANYGRTLQAAGRRAEALSVYERALARDPGLTVARTQYAYALADAGRVDDALAQLKEATERAPASAEAWFSYGTAQGEAGRTAEAVRSLEKAIALDPRFGPAHENLGTALASQKRWAEAAARFETAVGLSPETVTLRVQLAVSLVNAGRLAEAVPHFEAALEREPNSPELHENFSQVLRALGRTRDAFHHLEEAARLQRQR